MSKKQKEIDNLLERLECVGKIQNEIMKKFEELKRLHQMELKVKDVEYNELKERFQAHKEADCKTIQEQSDLIEELKYELAVFKKAYEMVCEDECSIQAYDYYIQQAKEIIESE